MARKKMKEGGRSSMEMDNEVNVGFGNGNGGGGNGCKVSDALFEYHREISSKKKDERDERAKKVSGL